MKDKKHFFVFVFWKSQNDSSRVLMNLGQVCNISICLATTIILGTFFLRIL